MSFLRMQISGIFDDFYSYSKRKRHRILETDNSNWVLRSIYQDSKSIFHKIKRKKYLSFGDETYLALEIMFRS